MSQRITVRSRSGSGRVVETTVAGPAGWSLVHVGPGEPAGAATLPSPRSIAIPPGRTVIVVNDAQRPTPTPWLLERLDFDPADPSVVVVVASGSHAPPSGEELREILGPFHAALRGRTEAHRPDRPDFVRLGRTSRGTPVEVNLALAGARSVVCLGSVEPHYFAGWTGGRKSLVPGLCSLETMRCNHRLALDPACAPGKLDGNPLHLDLAEGAAMVESWLASKGGAVRALNAVVAGSEVAAAAHGLLAAVLEELVPRAAPIYRCEVDDHFSLVVCFVDHPLDRDLYQALKAFENWKGAVAPGGSLVLAAACPGGMGPPTFRQFLGTPPDLETLRRRVDRRYELGDHKLVRFLRYLDSGRRFALVSPHPPGAAASLFPVFHSLEEALARPDLAETPGGGRLLVVEDAANLIPA